MRHRRAVRSSLGVFLSVGLALGAAGCGGDEEEPQQEATEEGDPLTYGELSVAEGWQIRAVDRTAGIGETTTSPEIRGEVTNEGDEATYALFEIVFAREGEPVSVVKCSSPEIPPGETADLLCPGLGQPVPQGYDQVVTREITR